MKSIISLAFCVLLGFLIANQGWTALMWIPAGFILLGMIAIILSRLSKLFHSSFRQNFNKTSCQPDRNGAELSQRQQKQLQAATKVTSNLFLNTIPGAKDAPVTLQFNLPDSRFRYLMFCLSAVLRACAPEMDKTDYARLAEGALSSFVAWAIAENPQDFFGGPVNHEAVKSNGALYLEAFMNCWAKYIELENAGMDMESIDLICAMIHISESQIPPGKDDINRLGKLGLQISCQLPTMNQAFVELVRR